MTKEAKETKAPKVKSSVSINAAERKKIVKRVMRQIMDGGYGQEIYEELNILATKAFGHDEINLFGRFSFVKNDISLEECEKIRRQLTKKVEKQLEKNHTFLVTARLINAFNALNNSDNLDCKNNKVKQLYEVVWPAYTDYYLENYSEAFRAISSLDE